MSSVSHMPLSRLAATHAAIACPVCRNEGKPFLESKGYPILTCSRCQHQWAQIEIQQNHVEENYSDDYFSGGGPGYANYLAESQALTQRGRDYARILSRFAPRHGTLLDVGAAAGFLSRGFEDAGWRTTGLEPNPQMAAYGRQHLALNMEQGSLEENGLQDTFDAVALIQVIAHFGDPHAALTEAARLTNPHGGLWLIETWDSQSRVARLLGRHWHEYSPPSALHYFSRQSLRTLAAGFGFEEIACGRPAKRIELQHAMSLLSYQFGEPRWMQWAKAKSTRFTLPYPGDDVFWTVFRRV